jgi:hypothetical protein
MRKHLDFWIFFAVGLSVALFMLLYTLAGAQEATIKQNFFGFNNNCDDDFGNYTAVVCGGTFDDTIFFEGTHSKKSDGAFQTQSITDGMAQEDFTLDFMFRHISGAAFQRLVEFDIRTDHASQNQCRVQLDNRNSTTLYRFSSGGTGTCFKFDSDGDFTIPSGEWVNIKMRVVRETPDTARVIGMLNDVVKYDFTFNLPGNFLRIERADTLANLNVRYDALQIYNFPPAPALAQIEVVFPEQDAVLRDNVAGGLVSWGVKISDIDPELLDKTLDIFVLYSRDDITTEPVFVDFWSELIDDTADRTIFIPKTNALIDGDYEVRAFLFDNDEQIASSGIVGFTIQEAEGFFPTPEFPDFDEPDFGRLGNFIVAALRWLFVPTQASINRFNDIGALLEQKPPVGYFFVARNALLTIDSEAAGVFEFEGVDEIDVFDDIKGAISLVLWAGFGFIIFNRIRHLQF